MCSTLKFKGQSQKIISSFDFQHSDKYLIHHFEFECNDKTAIGKFAGNCSLNKFMSLNDWVKIFDDLNDSIQGYVNNPNIRPASSVRRIDNTNFELNITWIDMDATFYSKLLTSVDFDCAFPFMIKLKVRLRSNIDKFVAATHSFATPVTKADKKTTLDRKRTADRSLKAVKVSLTNGKPKTPIKIKDCCVRLPLLQFDENGELIHEEVVRNNKRKHSTMACDIIHSINITPKNPDSSIFMCSSSSTPFVRNSNGKSPGVSDIANQKVMKRLTNRLTTTPRSSSDRKSGSNFNPRIRLLKLPEDVSQLSSPKKSKKKNTGKKTAKSKAKTTQKQPKSKVRSIPNESNLFETPENQPIRKATAKPNTKKPTPPLNLIVKIEKE